MAYVDSWDALVSKYPKLALVKIPGARLLVFEDGPELTDVAVTKFVEALRNTKPIALRTDNLLGD